MQPPFSKFPSYRSFQEEVIEQSIASTKKVVFINGPPGSGKSLIGMSIAYNFGRSLYICTTKPLQSQLLNDFPEFPMLMGRANYPCTMSQYTESKFPEITCDDCLASHDQDAEALFGQAISCKGRCEYEQMKRMALKANLAILNTSYFLTESNFIGRFSGRDMVIVDECDCIEGAILNFVEVNVSDRMLERLNLAPPVYKTKWESWKEWSEPISGILIKQVTEMVGRMKSKTTLDPKELKQLKRLKNLLSKIEIFKDNLDDSWIYQEIGGERGSTHSFKPTWISDIARKYFWNHGKRFILMSGTPPLPKLLGLEPEEWEWIDVPNQFDPARRPVYYTGSANLTQKTMVEERPKIIPVIVDILSKYPKQKGLIHTVSYNLANYILENIKSSRLVSHGNGSKERENLISRFKESDFPLVIISPSMERGLDLPMDYCRFIIIVKTMFPDLSNKQTARRLYSSSFGQYWYRWATVTSIVQASMRGMRSAEDQCDTFILDSQFANLYSKNYELFPGWWRESLRIVNQNNFDF